MAPSACWMALRLLLPAVFLSVAGAPPSAPLAAHSAAAALAALEDVRLLEERLAGQERALVESRALGPLEVFTALHDPLGLLFDSALAALRFAAAAVSAGEAPFPGSAEVLAEAAGLEAQLQNLLTVQTKEPLFFWHGPKWLALSKLRKLIGRGAWNEHLKALAATAGATSQSEILGKASEADGGDGLATQASANPLVPLLGVAVDDSFCGEGGPCDLLAVLEQATAASGKAFPKQSAGVHVIVLPSAEETLRRIGAALRAAEASVPKLFVSMVLGAGSLKDVQAATAAATHALGRKKLDLIWLPYDAFKKKQWPEVKIALEEAGLTYGVHSEIASKTVAQKLLAERQPKPAAWLTPDDLLRPAAREAVEVARGAGVAAVSLPRGSATASGLVAMYAKLSSLVSSESAQKEAVAQGLIRWALQRGLAPVLRLGRGDEETAAPAEVFRDLAEQLSGGKLPVSARLLEALRAAARPMEASKQPEKKGSSSSALEDAFQAGRAAMAAAAGAAQKALEPSAPQATVSGAPLEPGVEAQQLSTLPEQNEVYKANDHVIYREDFFDVATFAAIKAETQRLWRSKDIEANCNLDGKNRLGGYILDLQRRDSSLYNLIYGNEPFRRWVSAVNGEGAMWPSDFPIELREYGRKSKGMGCHPDLQMYAVPRKDLEFAFTVDNDSRCNVTFWDAAGQQHLVQTKPNSMMMVRVNAATHCVSPTDGGTRSILKFIYVGDYRKSKDFWFYTENECDDTNPNRQELDERRAARVAQEAALGGSLEL